MTKRIAMKLREWINSSYTLHLLGMPYRMLISGEFDNAKQIVGKVQFEDVLEKKAKLH